VHQGELIQYTVNATNKPDGGTGCNMNNVTIKFYQPAANGTATGNWGWLEYPGWDFPADGTGNKAYLSADHLILNYTVAVDPGVKTITAKAVAIGNLTDVPGGTYPTIVEKPISVVLLSPCVNVTKTPDTAFSKVGDVITYTIKVCNCGDVDLTKVSITDDVLGTLTGSFATTLPQGTCESHTFPHTVTASDPDPLVNVVTVYYQDYTAYAVSATATASVPLVEPCLNITKDGPATSKVGDIITYTFVITNCSPDTSLDRSSVTDTLLGDITSDFPATLAAGGGTATVTETYTVPPGAPDPLDNTVTAVYTVPELGNPVTATDSHSVDLLEPCLNITKDGPATSKAGDTITYTFVITNCSPDTTLDRQSVTDTVLGDITASFPSTLGVSEVVTVTKTYIVKTSDPDPLVNTVTAVYTVPVLGNPVTATASHSVDLKHPKISCSKTAVPDHGAIGDNITYTVEVCNTGDVDLNKVSIIDSLLGDLSASFVKDPLTVGDCESHDFTRAIAPSDSSPLVNTVTFNYVVPVLGNPVTCSASATVHITGEGCLEICKFQDANVNGMWDPGEPGLPDWKFRVTGSGYDEWWTTGDDGCVIVPGLVTGTYTVTEELKAGWYNTKPGGDPPYELDVYVGPGPDCARVEFGNREEIRDIPPNVPAMNKWGIIAMITLFAGLLVWTVRRKRLSSRMS
jgi:uncharacterized repeat protein (TIGR01451 family)